MQPSELQSNLENNHLKKPLNINSIEVDHLGIAVRSIKQALPFYEVLGLKPSFETVHSEKVKVACLTVNNNVDIELLEPIDSTSVIHKF